MELYRKAMNALDLHEWLEVKERICEEHVVTALYGYVAAYLDYKAASKEYDDFERHDWPITNDMRAEEDELWRAYTKSLKTKKKMWSALQEVLGEDCDLTSTDEE